MEFYLHNGLCMIWHKYVPELSMIQASVSDPCSALCRCVHIKLCCCEHQYSQMEKTRIFFVVSKSADYVDFVTMGYSVSA